ncbi:MAG TPA: nuclear transport factor 2 family protein [Acidobacteriaceae bacterium]|nr:nuclear transport factor 2 family protein [Acidobacteriaceae bacterium]
MVLRLAAALVFAFCFVLPAQATFPRRDSLHKEIESLEYQWRDALLHNDLTAIDQLLADDYLGISPNGTLETKADVLALRRSGRFRVTQMNLSDIKIRIYGDTAVVTSKVDLEGMNGDRDISGHYRYTRVYTDRGNQWKIVSFEASRVRDASHHPQKH